MKLLHSTTVYMAFCLSAVMSDSALASPRALCDSGDTPSTTTTPSMTPQFTTAPPTTTPAPTTQAPTTPAPTTPAPTTPAPTSPPRIASVQLTNSQNGKTLTLPTMTPRICYNVDQCSSTGYDTIAFYNFDVYGLPPGGANFLPFYEADCTRPSWYGFVTMFRDMEGQPDIRTAPTGRTFKSFVLQRPGDSGFGPTYETKDVCWAT